MAQTTALPLWFGPFAARPRLLLAMVGGVVAAFAVGILSDVPPVSAALIGWDVVCVSYLGSSLWNMAGSSPDEIRARAAREDQGRATILALVMFAAVAAIAAIMLELSRARAAVGLSQGLHVALAFTTVAVSWAMVHLIFALHYAHRYYAVDADGEGDAEGLKFPGKDEPNYWDFLYFSVIIGVASQTADVAITGPALRRLNTVHALFAFAFNTVIVALTINLLAGLVT